MNKAKLIREMKEKYPSFTSRQIAGMIDVKQGYVAHILWKAKLPSAKKTDFQKAYQELLIENNLLRKEIEKLEDENRKQKIVIKFLREN